MTDLGKSAISRNEKDSPSAKSWNRQRDIDDYPVLYSAIVEDEDLFVTGGNSRASYYFAALARTAGLLTAYFKTSAIMPV